MSYNLYITHKKDWHQEEPAKKIPKSEFVKFVDSHIDMKIVKNEKHFVQAGYETPESHGAWAIEWRDGDVRTNSRTVPREVFVILLEMSKQFHAPIQGEEGERYTEKQLESEHPQTIKQLMEKDAENSKRYAALDKKSSRKRLAKKILKRTLFIIWMSALISTVIGIFFIPSAIKNYWPKK